MGLKDFVNQVQLERIGDELERSRDPEGFAQRKEHEGAVFAKFMALIPHMFFSGWLAAHWLGVTQERLHDGKGEPRFFPLILGIFVAVFPLNYAMGKISSKLLQGYTEDGFWKNYYIGLLFLVMGWIVYGTVRAVTG